MPSIFTFSPDDTAIKIKTAACYTPRILQNHITVRPYNGFIYVVRGSYTYTHEGGRLTAHSGELICLPAGCAPYDYTIQPPQDEEGQTIQIEFELRRISENVPFSLGPRPFLIPLSDSNSVRYALRTVISAHAKGTAASKFLSVSEFFRIISLCSEENPKSKSAIAANKVAPAIAYLETHCTERISSAMLASLCQISESQLRRSFLATTGMSPVSYKRRLLHLRACDLLRMGEFKIGEIAEMLGFYDIYAFSHFFTQAEGISPREFCRLSRITS